LNREVDRNICSKISEKKNGLVKPNRSVGRRKRRHIWKKDLQLTPLPPPTIYTSFRGSAIYLALSAQTSERLN
jgi:hypothetical protein